jgi:hypothetical protein
MIMLVVEVSNQYSYTVCLVLYRNQRPLHERATGPTSSGSRCSLHTCEHQMSAPAAQTNVRQGSSVLFIASLTAIVLFDPISQVRLLMGWEPLAVCCLLTLTDFMRNSFPNVLHSKLHTNQ